MLNVIFVVAMSRWEMGTGEWWSKIISNFFKQPWVGPDLDRGTLWKMIWGNVLVIECILSFQSSSSQIPNFPKHFLRCNSTSPPLFEGNMPKILNAIIHTWYLSFLSHPKIPKKWPYNRKICISCVQSNFTTDRLFWWCVWKISGIHNVFIKGQNYKFSAFVTASQRLNMAPGAC